MNQQELTKNPEIIKRGAKRGNVRFYQRPSCRARKLSPGRSASRPKNTNNLGKNNKKKGNQQIRKIFQGQK